MRCEREASETQTCASYDALDRAGSLEASPPPPGRAHVASIGIVLLALPLRIIKRFEVPEVEPSRAVAQAAHHEVRFEAAVGTADVVRDVSDLSLHPSQVITPDTLCSRPSLTVGAPCAGGGISTLDCPFYLFSESFLGCLRNALAQIIPVHDWCDLSRGIQI